MLRLNIFMFLLIISISVQAQKVDEERMRRDVLVGADILRSLIRQQFTTENGYFPVTISGGYQNGYGITFNLPADLTIPIAMTSGQGFQPFTIVRSGPDNVSTTYSTSMDQPIKEGDASARARIIEYQDSLHEVYYARIVDACREFLTNYSDILSQLPPAERIVISNQNANRQWSGQFFNAPNLNHIAVEARKEDLNAYRTGKITRDQVMSRIKVVNTRSMEKVDPDIELLADILYRVWSPDFSRSFFTEDNIYYERLKDFGVIYYLQVYSSTASNQGLERYNMPTLRLENLSRQERDDKVKTMVPRFETEMKEMIVDYARTLRSLGPEEQLIVQVKLTRCTACGIPSTVEFSVKGSVLAELNSGKMDRNAAIAKIEIKRTGVQ